jgi:hypothetical protein
MAPMMVEIGTPVREFLLKALTGGDPCSAMTLIAILLGVGSHMVQRSQRLHAFSVRLSTASFIGCLLFLGVETHALTTAAWTRLAVRSLFVAAFVLGVAWMFLPVIAFFAEHLIARPAKSLRWKRESFRGRRDDRARSIAQERQRERDQRPSTPNVKRRCAVTPSRLA